MRKHTATFANLTLKFGEKSLLDYSDEIVLPAFLDPAMVRSYGDNTHYHFYDTSLVKLADDTAGIAGRLIKDTTLSRTQIYEPEKGLIKDEQSIRSSPSSFFLLILNNHRLVYFPETPHAPDLSAFKSTLAVFLKDKHKAYIKQLHEELSESGERVTKKQLFETHPHPHLEVIPLTSSEGIEEFVRGYDKLKSMELRLIKPNDEFDGEEMFNELREYFHGLNPKATKINSSNPEGLDKERAIEVIHDATATGTQEINLVGTDEHGNKLRGNNDNFRVAVEIPDVPKTKRGLTKKLFSVFSELVDENVLPVPQLSQDTAIKVIQKVRTLLGK